MEPKQPEDMAREFQQFVNEIKFRGDHRQLWRLMRKMRETGKSLGMSDSELDSVYDAKTLVSLYRQTMQ